MEDLIQSQIKESCKLSLPVGLRELMCDISREVLRAQPTDLYQFIADYLSALLIARDTMSIACKVCDNVCECLCEPVLDEELKKMGLEGNELEMAKSVIVEYFDKDTVVKEGPLLMKLFKKTNIDDNMLFDIQEAVRRVFLRQRLSKLNALKVASADLNESERAAQNTINFYQNNNDNELQQKAATRIQKFFRAHLARRRLHIVLKRLTLVKAIEAIIKERENSTTVTTSKLRAHGSTSSVTPLARSFMDLPKHMPYSVHDIRSTSYQERENKSIDYTSSTTQEQSMVMESKLQENYEAYTINTNAIYENDENSVEEDIESESKSENSSIDEIIATEHTSDVKDILRKININYKRDISTGLKNENVAGQNNLLTNESLNLGNKTNTTPDSNNCKNENVKNAESEGENKPFLKTIFEVSPEKHSSGSFIAIKTVQEKVNIQANIDNIIFFNRIV